MEDFEGILHEAAQALGQDYFLLAIDGADPVYRERVYCYELYHQLRVRWPESCDWKLNDEVDKQVDIYFRDGRAPKPGLLIHIPGTDRNYVVMEVKVFRVDIGDIRKDLTTLSIFVNRFGYEMAGFRVEHGSDDLHFKVEKTAQLTKELRRIGVLWHSQHGLPAKLVPELVH